jgi:hypothetical protein
MGQASCSVSDFFGFLGVHQNDKASLCFKSPDESAQAVGEGTKTIQANLTIWILIVPFLFLKQICSFIQFLIPIKLTGASFWHDIFF